MDSVAVEILRSGTKKDSAQSIGNKIEKPKALD